MSNWTQHRSLDSLISCEWSTGAVDYYGYLYPGNFNDKPNPPLNPFKVSYKSVQYALRSMAVRQYYAGALYAP